MITNIEVKTIANYYCIFKFIDIHMFQYFRKENMSRLFKEPILLAFCSRNRPSVYILGAPIKVTVLFPARSLVASAP